MNNLNPNEFLPLLRKIVDVRYRRLISVGVRHIPLEELVNEGYIGLNQAAEKYDPEMGTDPNTFVAAYISHAISGFLRKEDVVDYRVRKKLKKIKKAREQLEQKLGREPTEEEISKELNVTVEKYRKLLAMEILVICMDQDDDIQIVPKSKSEDREQLDLTKKLGEDTNNCLKNTLTKEQVLIILLKEFRGFTIESIVDFMGAEFNISRVWRTNNKAKSLMRDCLQKKGWDLYDIMAIYDPE